MFRYHLVYRVTLFNAVIVAGLIWAWLQGYVQPLFAGHAFYFGLAMVAIFAITFVGFARRALKTSKAMNAVKAGERVDTGKLSIKAAFVGNVSAWLVTMGLIGNLVGFAHAVEGLDISGGPEAARQAIDGMMAGMKLAFYTTLIGTALGLWMSVNNHMLKTAIELLRIDNARLKIAELDLKV